MDSRRGLLDLIIMRLPSLKPGERAGLCLKYSSEEEISAMCRFAEARRMAERDAVLMKARGIDFVSIAEPGYPPLLAEIFDPPAALYYRGRLPDAGKPLLAVVGTRKPCAGALEWTYRFARDFGRAGGSVVSGLALGIDAMAHRGNLDGQGRTFAVLGSGCDEVAPASNRGLAARILAGGGGIISEYPPGTPPARWNFPQRNRVISGLCRSVLVAEAGEKSGALITADFALEQGRDLWVAARQPESPSKSSGFYTADAVFGEGCRRLAEDGAQVISRAEEVFLQWGGAAERSLDLQAREVKNRSNSLKDLTLNIARELGI